MRNQPKQQLYNLTHEKQHFQLERLILFSDAVFAIAITLLVIEIKVPEIPESASTAAQLKDALLNMLQEIFGFVLSFAVIGQFWMIHHKVFGYAKNFNNGLLWLNLFYLLWIVLVPFTSDLNARYGNLNFVWQLYSLNLFMISVSLLLIFRYIANPRHQLSDISEYPILCKYSKMRSFTIAFIFLLGALLAIPDTTVLNVASRLIFFLIPVALATVNKRQRKVIAKSLKVPEPVD